MNFTAFAITPPKTTSAHVRAVIASGAHLIPASILRMSHDPGSLILCPGCYSEKSLIPTWNSDGKSIVGFTCICGAIFDNSKAMHLVFGHLGI